MQLRMKLAFICALARCSAKDQETLLSIDAVHQEIGQLLIAIDEEVKKKQEEDKTNK